MGLLVRLRAGWFALALILSWHPVNAATELNESEIARLYSGSPVVREETVESAGHRYVGGLTYVLIDAPPARVLATLDDVSTYIHFLPATRSVKWLGLSRDGDSVVQLEQGTPLVHATYVVRTRVEKRGEGSPTLLRFWLDARFPHDVADATAYFRAEPLDHKTLLTYAAWVDLGPGLLNRLLEGRVRRAALSTPGRVKRYVEALGPFG